MKRNLKKRNEEGQALLLAIIFLVSLTLLGFGLILVASLDTHSSRNLRLNEQALNAAEEGAVMAMAYASDSNHTDFLSLAPGDSITINSITNAGKSSKDLEHYQVKIIKQGITDPPPGEALGLTGSGIRVVWVVVTIQSTGMVQDVREGGSWVFSFAKPPPIQRRVEVMARIRTSG